MDYPKLPDTLRLSRLAPRGASARKTRIVLDTDAYNEIDDQFAIVHALLSPQEISIEAIYAVPFHNARSSSPEDGMEQSYQEILKLLDKLQWPQPKFASPTTLTSTDHFVFRGSTSFLDASLRPQENSAVHDLIQRAMASPDDDPLTVVAIGASTNVVSAILLEPKIMEKIVIIWLGGHAHHWPHTRDFNHTQDARAAQILFDCGVPLVQLPCLGVVSHLHTTIPELETHVAGRGAIGDYLVEIVKGYNDEHMGWSKPIWDVAATSYVVNSEWTPSTLIPSPVLTDQATWSVDQRRHLIRYVWHIDRDKIFRDLFDKLADA